MQRTRVLGLVSLRSSNMIAIDSHIQRNVRKPLEGFYESGWKTREWTPLLRQQISSDIELCRVGELQGAQLVQIRSSLTLNLAEPNLTWNLSGTLPYRIDKLMAQTDRKAPKRCENVRKLRDAKQSLGIACSEAARAFVHP